MLIFIDIRHIKLPEGNFCIYDSSNQCFLTINGRGIFKDANDISLCELGLKMQVEHILSILPQWAFN